MSYQEDLQGNQDRALVKKADSTIQPRESKYGDGVNQRVFELPYKNFLIGVNLGDITEAPTEAVMCPTTPVLEIGGGAVERALYRAVGRETYDAYAHQLMSIIERVRNGTDADRLLAAQEFLDLIQTKTKLPLNASPEQAVVDILALTGKVNWSADMNRKPEHVSLLYGMAIAAPSGNLEKRGIQTIVLTNVTPEKKDGMTVRDMAMFTYNACIAALRAGADSITIPAIGTGFASMYGFGLRPDESLIGFLEGVKQFVDDITSQNESVMHRIDYNMYVKPSEKTALEIATLMGGIEASAILTE